jgi:adenylate kinase family enzyme
MARDVLARTAEDSAFDAELTPHWTDGHEATLSSIRSARRILVLGSSGSGKTQLSVRLAEILGIDPIHLDAHFWREDARPREDREWREIVSKLASRDAWIMDGTYERSLDLRIPRADAILLLECAPDRCLERVVRRDAATRDDPRLALASGSAKPVDANHVRYVREYPAVTRPQILACIERYGRGKPVATIPTPEGVAPFLSQLATKPT